MSCRKRSYLTKREAKRDLAVCQAKAEQGLEHRRERRIYRCGECGAYHLTSQPHYRYDTEGLYA